MKTYRYCLATDLRNDESLIAEYKKIHEKIWPEITKSIKDQGITVMDIYNTGNRLFMIMEVNEDFSFEKKAAADAANITVQEWETMLWKFQQALPWAEAGAKWILMDKIFELDK